METLQDKGPTRDETTARIAQIAVKCAKVGCTLRTTSAKSGCPLEFLLPEKTKLDYANSCVDAKIARLTPRVEVGVSSEMTMPR